MCRDVAFPSSLARGSDPAATADRRSPDGPRDRREAEPSAGRASPLRETFDRAQHDALREAVERPALDWKVVGVLLTTAVTLTLQEYVFRSGNLDQFLRLAEGFGAGTPAQWIRELIVTPQDRRLAELLFWACGSLVTYVVIPGLVVRVAFRERIRSYGLRVRGIWPSSWVYLVMFAAMIAPLAYFSTTAAFQAKYPFYNPAPGEPLWPRPCVWECFYIMQFFALEFFFRGFMVQGLRRRFGFYAIFVMMVPYCMIHFGKPLPETCGAIGAGIVLGFMSLKTRSIWLGAGLHVAVAMTMDFLALWHKGLL